MAYTLPLRLLKFFHTCFFCMICLTARCDATETQSSHEEQVQNPISIQLIAEEQSIQPERPFWVALQMNIQPGWHTYWKNPGGSGMPCHIDWKLPEGFEVRSLLWQTPKRYSEEGLSYFGYQEDAILLAEIMPAANAAQQPIAVLEATLSWVACNSQTCLPGDSVHHIDIPVLQTHPVVVDAQIPLFAHARRSMPSSKWKTQAVHVEPNLIALTLIPPSEMEPWEDKNFVADFFSEIEGMDIEAIKKDIDASTKEWRLLVPYTSSSVSQKEGTLRGVVVIADEKDALNPKASIAIDLPIQPQGAHFTEATPSISFSALLLTLFFAFLGGALLNCMPCVLPVLSVKLMQLIKMTGESRRILTQHAAAYTAGIVLSFWVLAGLIILLQTYGESVGWGFQLQEPLFVALLALFLLLFALNLFGIFEWGMLFASWAGNSASSKKQTGLFGAFCSGVLATVVATPCTGPFLGAAVGLAVTLPPLYSLLIFTFIALGLSLPYVLVSISPKLLRHLPRPGAWMVSFKEGMGFLLLATVLWLISVFAFQTDMFSLLMLLTACLIASFAAWMYGKWSVPSCSPKVRILSGVLSCGFLILSLYVVTAQGRYASHVNEGQGEIANEESRWKTFAPQAVEAAVKSGKPVLVDFTASWCLICQANHYVLETERVREQLDNHHVVCFKADWTLSNPVITQALREHGRSGVPLYLLYAPYAETPIILPQLLTPESVVDALKTMHQVAI